jgi:hypothetical protein
MIKYVDSKYGEQGESHNSSKTPLLGVFQGKTIADREEKV